MFRFMLSMHSSRTLLSARLESKTQDRELLSLLVNSQTLNSMTGGKVSTVRRSSMLVWEVE